MAKKKPTQLVEDISQAIDKGLARFVVGTQSKLSAAAPVDTGRLASSFFVGENIPNRDEAAKRDEPGPVTVERFKGKITADNDYWISNNLPYAARAAFDPRWAKGGRRGGAAWFSEIQNNLPKDMDSAMNYWLKKIK